MLNKQGKGGIYNTLGHKLRFPQGKKAQFPGTARQGRCVTVMGITSSRPYSWGSHLLEHTVCINPVHCTDGLSYSNPIYGIPGIFGTYNPLYWHCHKYRSVSPGNI